MGDYQQAEELQPDYIAGDILDNMEKGRVSFLNSQYQKSKDYFELSEKAVREQQDKAVISASETVINVSSLAVNDNLTAYEPADYELGFLHLYLGLNYLRGSSLEGALVEVRKANLIQEQARKKREEELQEAESDLKEQGMSSSLGSLLANYPDAGKTLQAVQNGYLLYLSALLYETADELNNAYVDYRRALAVVPNNEQVIDGTIRVARKLGMREDLEKLTRTYGEPIGEQEKGQIIVIEERGVVGAQQSWNLSMPFYSHRGTAVHSLALPYYPPQQKENYPLIRLNNKALTTFQLVDVNLMAQRDLRERIPMMLTRLILRVIAKEQLRRGATNDKNGVGNLLFNVWNMVTEQPDTRSWQTLPAEVYSSSRYISPGEHQLDFGSFGFADGSYTVKVNAGDTVLVWLSRQGINGTVWHKQLGDL